MEYWIFSKKELHLIADLMVQTLLTLPDKSELSVMQLFGETMKSVHIKGEDKEGYPIHGLKLLDFKLKTGGYLSKMIKWDFKNAIWNPDYSQGFDLLKLFTKKATRAGFIVDGSDNHGLYLGQPQYIPEVYRSKKNLLASFEDVPEIVQNTEANEIFYIHKQYETIHRHREWEHKQYPRISDSNYTRELQLWRIPAGNSTGLIPNETGRVTCYVIEGKCTFECSQWQYGYFIDDEDNGEEAKWKELKEVEQLTKDRFGFSESNDKREETTAPHNAWYKIANTGKTDLLVYVVDADKAKTLSYAPLIGIGRLRMGTDGKGIRTLIAFHDCELDCKYCINPQCKSLHTGNKIKYMSAKDIVDTIKKDELYYLATNGGITIGGGEPLLHHNFLINDLFKVYGKNWHVTVETSLHVTPWMLFDLSQYIDEYVVDVKDMNPDIYKKYTGKDNDVVVSNLKWLIEKGKADHILVRLPLIPGYNTDQDRQKSRQILEEMGITRFNLFTYKTKYNKK